MLKVTDNFNDINTVPVYLDRSSSIPYNILSSAIEEFVSRSYQVDGLVFMIIVLIHIGLANGKEDITEDILESLETLRKECSLENIGKVATEKLILVSNTLYKCIKHS